MNRSQAGYTLIELMISSVLGLMMIAGFGSLFSQTQTSSTIQHSLSYMMEDGRYILEVFGKELRRTGSLRNKLTATGAADAVFTADANVFGSTMSFLPGEYIRGEYNAAGFGTAFNINRLALRYQLNNNTELAQTDPNSTNSACERSILLTAGEDPAIQTHVVTLYFFVALDTTNVPVLYCQARRDNLTATTSVTSAAEPMISDVQKLLVTYGIDNDNTNDGDIGGRAANYYVGAGSVTDWQQVVSARISVVLRSDTDNLTKSAVSYTPIDNNTYTATDRRYYREFSTTIAFRNQI